MGLCHTLEKDAVLEGNVNIRKDMKKCTVQFGRLFLCTRMSMINGWIYRNNATSRRTSEFALFFLQCMKNESTDAETSSSPLNATNQTGGFETERYMV